MAKWYERAARGVGGSIVGGGVGLPMLGTARGAMWDETNDWNNARGTDIEDWYDEQGGKWYDPGDILGNKATEDAADAAREAGQLQHDSSIYATDIQKEMFDQSRKDMLPWQEAGARSLANIEGNLESGAYDPGEFSFDYEQYDSPEYQEQEAFSLDDLYNDPAYQFMRDQGEQAIERRASARGGQMGTRTDMDLMRFNQGLASQEAGNAFNRWANQRDFGRRSFEQDRGFGRNAFDQDRGFAYGQAGDEYSSKAGRLGDLYNRQASLANIGQTQSGAIGTLGGNFGQAAANNYMQGANALAAGRMGAANAQQQGAQNKAGMIGTIAGLFA